MSRLVHLAVLLLAVAALVLPTARAPLAVAQTQPQTQAQAAACQFLTASGTLSPIQHVVTIQFDNVHFTRDNPDVPSDLEQMPSLLGFIEQNGTLLANEHTPLIAHTANDLITGLTGVYGDQHGISINNSFQEASASSSPGSSSLSAFGYWTDPLTAAPNSPYLMVDANGGNLPAPWLPFLQAGCNVGAVATANMVLENNGADVTRVFGAGSPQASESPSSRTGDLVGIAVHCADTACSTVGNGSGSGARPEPGGMGFGALFGHAAVAAQVGAITRMDGSPISGFDGFDPDPNYTLGYLASLLQNNVPVVYGYIADAHDSRVSCGYTSPNRPTLPASGRGGAECGAYAPGEAGYVARLRAYDQAFAAFFARLASLGIDQSNTLFTFQADENDHFAGSAPLNPGCDGVTVPCQYDRGQVGEVTTDLPLLLRQQGLYDFGRASGGARDGFSNTDPAYAIDADTAPAFWLKGQPATADPALRGLETALARVTAPNPYTGATETLFRYLVDAPGLQALHMLTGDPNRNPGIVGFGAEDHFIQTSPLVDGSYGDSVCNQFPGPDDAVCLSNGYAWMHGDFAPDIDNPWAALVGPGVVATGVDQATWADHADLRPTAMALLCLRDSYPYAGRALLEDVQDGALTVDAAANRDLLTQFGATYKALNAPLGQFGQDAIQISTRAIQSDAATYQQQEAALASLVAQRDALAAQIQAQLGALPGCTPASIDPAALQSLNQQAQALLAQADSLASEGR